MAHVRELLELLARSPDDLGMAMAGVDDGNAGRKVDVAAAFGVPEFRVAGTFCKQGGHHAHAAGDGGSPALRQGFLAHDGSPRWVDKVVVGGDNTRGRVRWQLTLSCISEDTVIMQRFMILRHLGDGVPHFHQPAVNDSPQLEIGVATT